MIDFVIDSVTVLCCHQKRCLQYAVHHLEQFKCSFVTLVSGLFVGIFLSILQAFCAVSIFSFVVIFSCYFAGLYACLVYLYLQGDV